MKSVLLTLITIFAISLWSPGHLTAQLVTTSLDDGSLGSLRGQIDAATAGASISFMSSVTTVNLNDEIVIDKDITINGLAVVNTTIDANQNSRIFNVQAGTVILNNLNLTNGLAGDGGGILNNSNVTMNDCFVGACVANGVSGSGGGVFNSTGAVFAANDTEFNGNVANRAGGAIEDNSGAGTGIILSNVTMTENNAGASPAATAAPGNGGAFHITGPGDATVSNCIVRFNISAAEGGGLWNGSGTMTVTGSTISDNTNIGDGANQGGAGLFNAGGTLLVSGCTINNNETTGPSTSGGGILNDLGVLTVSNTTISGNTSVRAGGGIEDNSAAGNTLSLTEVTLSNNSTQASPGNGGGLHITGPGDSDITDCIANENFASAEGGGLWNGTGQMNVLRCTIDGNTVLGNGADQGGAGIFNAGGTVNVTGGSITNNETTGTSTSGGGILNDLGILTVMGTEISGNISVRAGGGIEDNSTAGNTLILGNVNFNNNTTGASPGNGGGLHITGPGNSTITGSSFTMNMAAAEGGGVWNGSGEMSISDCTITNNTVVGDGANQGGGGVFNAGGTVTINAGEINNNTTTGTSTSGGGILNDMGTLTVIGTMINGNTSIRAGGGIEDNSSAGGMMTLRAVTITNNTTGASPGNGGGVHITGPGNSLIESCTVSSNEASAEGGGLWNGAGLMTVNSTTLEGNIVIGDGADQGGGGIFNAGGTIVVDACDILTNQSTGPSTSGGGILNDLGVLTVTNSSLVGNSTIRAGGGIEDNSAMGNTLTVTNVFLSENTTGASPGNGGGIHISGPGNSMITACNVSDNTAAAEGGGLWNGTGFMTVRASLIAGNETNGNDANQGGAGLFNAGGTMMVDSCSISANIALGTSASGGGILNDLGVLTVINSLIQDNTSVRAGGGIEDNSLAGNTLILQDVSLFNNSTGAAPGNGGGLHITGPGDSEISGCVVRENSASSEGGGLWNGTGLMTISGATIIESNIALGADADHGGGGIFNNGGDLNISDGTIVNQNLATGAAGSGGGLLSTDGEVTITDSEFSNNSANRAGGAVEIIDGDLTFRTSTMSNNDVNGVAGTPAPGNGGGIHVTGNSTTVVFFESMLMANSAGREGGAVWNQAGSTMNIFNSTIDGNSSFGVELNQGGAGVFNNGGIMSIAGSTISNNMDMGEGASGAGIHNKGDGEINVRISTLSSNTSTQGAGIYNGGVAMTIEESTIAFNNASNIGGGIDGTGMTSLQGTIVSNNAASTGSNLSGAEISSGNYNLIMSDAGGVFLAMSDDITDADPLLLGLSADGQATATHSLDIGSPAYNAGNPSTMTLDQNGNAIFAGRRDIGAHESQENLMTSIEVLSAAESNIRIFPNPTSSQTSVDIPRDFGDDITISIFSASTGQLLSEVAASNGTNFIQLGRYPNGAYIIKVNSSTFTNAQLINKIK
jgi:hypothetical protein